MTTVTKELIKKKQLKTAFKTLITDMLRPYRMAGIPDDIQRIDITADLLLKEVSIRTPLK